MIKVTHRNTSILIGILSIVIIVFYSLLVSTVQAQGGELYAEDFEGMSAGDDAIDWFDTQDRSSMYVDDSLFKVYDVGGNLAMGTTSKLSDIHSHYVGGGSDGWSDYRFSGRMQMTSSNSGIGVTFYSQYANDDIYYRLRRYASNTTFHLAPHGTSLEGTLDSGVAPLINVWYWFVIEVENVDGRTDIRAMVWPEGDPQPVDWQIEASDSSASRISAGRFGLWSYRNGSKYWDDLSVEPLVPSETRHLDLVVTGPGTVTKEPNLVDFVLGSTAQLSAVPDIGSSFSGWSGDATGSENPLAVTMDADKSITATFAYDAYTLNVSQVGLGTVTKNPDQTTYQYGDVVTVTAEPAVGWRFGGWSGDVTATEATTDLTITDNTNITAHFEEGEYMLTVNSVGDCTVTKDPNKTYFTSGEMVTLTAAAGQGWIFEAWSGDLLGNNPTEQLSMTSDKTVTATCIAEEYGLTITELGQGSVSVDPLQATYHYGDVVTLTAEPAVDWRFDGWSEDLSGAANPQLLTILGDAAVTAAFVPDSDTDPPLISNIQAAAGETSATITWDTDEPATSSIAYGPSTAYENGNISDSALVTGHTITLIGLLPDTLYHYEVTSEDESGNSVSSVDLTFSTSNGPTIGVWYGLNQSFGSIGTTQSWVNILGNVSDPDGVNSLVYTLNGGPERSLSIGPDNRRLQAPGDFNIDLDLSDLVEGVNEVVITASDTMSNQSVETVIVNYESGKVWPLPYSIDWNSVTDIQDVAQVVDGKWSIGSEGLRTEEPGYDRLVAIGDMSWTDYEVTVPITIHSADNSGGVGVLMRWQGHTDSPVVCSQPKCGWVPNGNIGWWRFFSPVELEWYRPLLSETFILSFETSYLLKLRVESTPGQGGYYSLKAWEAGQAEPAEWNLTMQEDSNDLASGSIMLIAHNVDATYGNVSVAPIGANEPPVVSNIQVAERETSATITWDTNEPATSSVAYGESTAYENGSVSDSALVTSHALTLTGLLPDTLYHYQVTSEDGSGNSASTVDLTFTTTNTNEPPVISNIQVAENNTSATITWDTDEPATSSVAYGPSAAYENGSVSDSALVTGHAITLTGLQPDTVYHYEVTAEDGSGNSASSVDLTFTTSGVVAVSGITSDDFSSCSLDTGIWTIVDPLGDAAVTMNGSVVEIGIPGGINHDAWTVNESARIMQAANNVDFEIEAKFESAISERYQDQGILVEQDSANYLRFDFYSDGTASKIYAASFTNGTVSAKVNSTIADGAPLYMRVGRQGDQWTMSYSYDGSTWITGVSFVHSLAVSSVGPYAGNSNTGTSAPAHVAVVDYFFDTAAPVVPENDGPRTLLINTDGMGSVVKNPEQATYACGETVTLTVTPDAGWEFGGWSGDVSSSENPLTLTIDSDKVVTATFVAGITGITSDDFSSCSLNTGVWTIVDPFGDATVTMNGSAVEIGVPTGVNHEPWTVNESARIMQAANNVDFELEAKFDSPVSEQFQEQGILVEQDATNYLRFDFHSDGDATWIYAASFTNGLVNARVNRAVPNGAPLYMKVNRQGDQWTMSYSYDGATWMSGVSFEHSLAVSSVGPFAGNFGSGTSAPAHVAVVDYFFDTAAPVVPESDGSITKTLLVNTDGMGSVVKNPDQATFACGETVTLTATPDAGWEFGGWSGGAGGSENPLTLLMDADKVVTAAFVLEADTMSPVLSNIEVASGETSATITWDTDEPATSSVAYGPSAAYENGSVSDSALVIAHALTLTGLQPDTLYHYQSTSEDGSGNSASSVDLTFTTSGVVAVSGITSDDFSSCSLDTGIWTIVDPLGDAAVTMNGSVVEIGVPGGINHDAWTVNESARIMQAANNVDFEIEAKFESAISERYQDQGILVEQDSANYLRFDFHSDGTASKIYVASFTNGSFSAKVNSTIVEGAPLYMRVGRVGDQWTMSYSYDGTNWTTGVSFVHSLAVSSVGPFAGNYGAGTSAPAHVAIVDYFFDTVAPLVPEQDGPSCP